MLSVWTASKLERESAAALGGCKVHVESSRCIETGVHPAKCIGGSKPVVAFKPLMCCQTSLQYLEGHMAMDTWMYRPSIANLQQDHMIKRGTQLRHVADSTHIKGCTQDGPACAGVHLLDLDIMTMTWSAGHLQVRDLHD